MVSMISEGRSRPSIPEYQTIADHVRQSLDEVYYGIKEPKQALDDAAAKSAKVLGWLRCRRFNFDNDEEALANQSSKRCNARYRWL
jgi:hypothetical protein